MLVFCNGAPKSGSTWLYNILYELKEYRSPADEYLTENSRKSGKNPCIRPDKLAAFLSNEDYRSQDYISKNHLGQPHYRDLLLKHDDVVVFDIERDIRDVIVSAYYDHRNRENYSGDFEKFYWSEARPLAESIISYHNTWRSCGEHVCISSYEGLQTNFVSEAKKIAETMGISLGDERALEIKAATTMENLRERYNDDELYQGDKFFRKGSVGDWKSHFDERMTTDIEQITSRGLSRFDLHQLKNRIGHILRRVTG